MTELLEQALEAVRTMPAVAQDDIARGVLRLAAKDDDATSPVTLSPEERAARGELAADADVQAVWARHGL